MTYLVIMIDIIPKRYKYIIMYLWDFNMYFSYYGLFISLSNILLSYCPKNIEGIFSSIFFSIEVLNYIFSIFFTGILL